MDLDAVALWYLVSEPDLATDVGITDGLLVSSEARSAASFVRLYQQEYGKSPPLEVVVDHGAGITPPPEGTAVDFVRDLLHERASYNAMAAGVTDVSELLERGDVDEAYQRWLGIGDQLQGTKSDQLGIQTLADIAPKVLAQYEDIKAGKMGVPFPWPSLNRMTMGMWPGQLTYFVARPSVGKTNTLTLCSLFAHHEGYRVLIVSPEMDAVQLGERMISFKYELAYSKLASGLLSPLQEERLRHEVEHLAKDPSGFRADELMVLSDEEKMDSDSIEAAVRAKRPHLVAMDSSYMIRVVSEEARRARAKELNKLVVDWQRRMVRRQRCAGFAISQLSREATKISGKSREKMKVGDETAGLENAVALTDNVLWAVSNLFALYRDADMEGRDEMLILPLKIRRQLAKQNVLVNWNFKTMDFSEIGEPKPEFRDLGFDEDIPL